MKFLSGFIVGLILGFLLKRSRLCFTGLIRDAYLERKPYELALFGTVIAVQAVIYHGMGHLGLITIPSYLPAFSLVGVALGSVLFGFGAALAGGCLVSTLVKCGDGRIVGFATLAAFLVSGYAVSAGFAMDSTRVLRSIAVVTDDAPGRLTLLPLALAVIATVMLVVALVRHQRLHRPRFTLPAQYTGLRHVLCEKIWTRETAVVLIGVLMGVTFLVSEQFGRRYGCTVALPLLSWVYAVADPPTVVGGCNPYDVAFGWASMFVLGIAAGSFATTLASGELSLVKPARSTLIRGIVGGLLMGCGAIWGTGCLVSNGLVGTAQFSVKSWYALVFLAAGIWLGARFLKARRQAAGRKE